ncbi:MAG: phosphatidylglycerophosphatase A [Arsenophonus endosymbiont of Ceratovacuna japonica]
MVNIKLASNLSNLLNPWYLLATGFGSGLLPIIPGTIGSLVAIPFWLFMHWLLPVWFCWFIILFSFIFSIAICDINLNNIYIHDHSSIVWDEFLGIWIILMIIPLVNWQWIFIAFILFRFFDILKPWPINWFDKQINGWLGIMLDDIIASIFSIIIITIIYSLSILK